MTQSQPLWMTSRERDINGQFAPKEYGEKKLRSMKLSDHAWEVLEHKANEQGMSRTDIIEEFVRAEEDKQKIVIEALKAFIELKRGSRGQNQHTKNKEFSTETRDWRLFNECLKLAETAPHELGLSD